MENSSGTAHAYPIVQDEYDFLAQTRYASKYDAALGEAVDYSINTEFVT